MYNEEKKQETKSIFKELLFTFFSCIIQNQPNSLLYQFVISIIQTIQIISFTLDPSFNQYWKNDEMANKFNNCLKYFRVIYFFSGDKVLYSIGFFIAVIIIISYVAISFYIAFCLHSENTITISKWILHFLAYSFQFFLNALFIPLLNILASICHINNNNVFYTSNLQKGSALFYSYLTISIIFMLILIFFSSLGTYLCYDQIYNKSNINAKQTASPDMVKFLLSICLVLFSEIWIDHLVFIVVYFIISIWMIWLYYSLSNLYNEKMSKINICTSMILLWNSFCLFLSEILSTTEFNGGLILFICGIPSIIVILTFFYENEYHISDLKRADTSSRYGYLNIVKVIDLIKEVNHNERKSRVLLESYIYSYELTCPITNCPLTKYGAEIRKGNYNVSSFLLQHVEVRFKRLLMKFPGDSFAKIMYAYFLYCKLNRRTQADAIMTELKQTEISLSEEFLLYRINLLFDNDENDIFQTEHLSFSNLFLSFQTKILKISKLYISFWSKLYFYHQNTNEDLSTLNDVGYEIEKTRNEINEEFEELQHIKPNNIQVLRYYADFLNEVLSDKENGSKYLMKIKEIRQETKNNLESHLAEIDLKSISSDEFQFILISSKQQDFGTIIDVSLGVCSNSGYLKNELIGKNLNVLLPEMLRSAHHQLIKTKIEEYKQKEIDEKGNNKHTFKTHVSYLLTKAKFIIPVVISPVILTNESNTQLFIARVSHPERKSLNMEMELNSSCYVLTNLNYIIQNYSIEALRLLALNVKETNENNLHFGNFIKDFKTKLRYIKQGMDIRVQWSKKSDLYNVNKEFICTISMITIGDINIGYSIKMTVNKNRSDSIIKIKQSSFTVINKDFIPKESQKSLLIYNVDKNSYSHQKEKEDITDVLKQRALDKINKLKKSDIQQNEHSEEEEYSDNSDYTEDSEESDVTSSMISTVKQETKDYSPTNFFDSKQKENRNNNEVTGYYTVSMKEIKLFLYDYNKKAIVEYHTNENISQVQKRIKEIQEPTITKKIELKKKQNITPEKHYQELEKKKHISDEKKIKQIKYALDKNEASFAINRLRVISFLIFCILIAEGIFVYIFFNESYEQIAENCTLIQNSFKMLLNCAYSIFFTRELTLLAFPEYTITYQDDKEYLKDTFKQIKEIYMNQQELTAHILTTFIKLSKKAEQQLYRDTYEIYMITDTYGLKSFNISLNAALSQTLGAQFILSTMEVNDIIPTHKSVYFNFLNSLNGLYTGLLSMADIFESELNDTFDNKTLVVLICLMIFIVLAIVFFFVLSTLYFGVVFKKNDYLSVFYEISIDVIRLSLDHCENFNQKIMLVSNDDSQSSINPTISNDDDNDIEDMNISVNSQSQNSNDAHHQKKAIISSKNNTIFLIKLMILIVMIVSPICFTCIFFYTRDSFNYFRSNIAIYKANAQLNTRYLMLFNLLREYMFDKDIYVKYLHLTDYFQDEITTIIAKTIDSQAIIDKHRSSFRGRFKELYQAIYYENVCDYSKEFFETTITQKYRTCDYITYNASHYGLSILQPFFLDEVKEMKSLFDSNMAIAKEKGFKYNLTYYGTEEYRRLNESLTEEEQIEYEELHPIHLFTTTKHDNLVIIFKEILIPLLNTLSDALIYNNVKQQDKLKHFNTLIVFIYFGFMAIVYFIIWRRMEMGLKSTIKKAKNMLMLLPKELLVGLESVVKLFDINVNNSNEVSDEDSN